MLARTKNRVKVASDSVLFLALALVFLTGVLKNPLLVDSMSEGLYQRYQELPWDALNFLHAWCGVIALGCVVIHLSLVYKRYLWLLMKGWNSGK